MKTNYKIGGHDVYLPDQWEASYKDGIGMYSETFTDDTPQEMLENSVAVGKYVMPEASFEISGKTLTVKVHTNTMAPMMASEFLTQYMLIHGMEKTNLFIQEIHKFLDIFEKLFEEKPETD